MDVRKRLNLGDEMPPELASRKTKVFETLNELKKEVKPIEEATETLKDTDSMKDSKTFLNVLQKKFHVSNLYNNLSYVFYKKKKQYLPLVSSCVG